MLSPWSSSHVWGDRGVVHLVVPNFDRIEVGRFRENAIDKRHPVCNMSGSYYVFCCSWEGEGRRGKAREGEGRRGKEKEGEERVQSKYH